MNDAKQSKTNLRWVVVVVLLMLGINGLATRLLENIWVVLREKGSPAYLPLQWWMAAPFTLFVFGVLSALLTSFSGGKNWLKMFGLLCGCKVIFTAVTALFFSSRLYPDPVEAALQAGLLSLPSLLVHILLSGTLVLFLKELFVGPIVPEEPEYEFLPKFESETGIPSRPAATPERDFERVGETRYEAASAFRPEQEIGPKVLRPEGVLLEEKPAGALHEPECPAEVPVSTKAPALAEPGQVLLPVTEILRSFPEKELAMDPSEIERATPVIPVPLEDILPQLPEGRVQVEASLIISAIPQDAFARPRQEVATAFPDRMMELPLREIVSRIPSSVLELPEQEMQPDVDAEYPDFFHELESPPATVALKPFAPAAPARPAPPRAIEPATPPATIETPAEQAGEAALVISEDERALLERSRDVITVSTDAILSQFPPGAVIRQALGEGEQAPDSLLVPLELIAPGLAAGEVKVHAKYIFPQLPKGCLAASELDIARSLPNGEVELSLREVVPQLPSHFLAPPEQRLQPELEEMSDPFPEETPPLPREAQPVQAPPARGRSDLSETPDLSEVSEAQEAPAPPTRAPVPSYAEMLREPDPLALPIETVARLLPKGTLRVSPEHLKQQMGSETIRLPRRLVMGQLTEGRVVVPVEILTAQFAPEHLGMSIEQVKARLAEGTVELPLRDVVGQVLEEIAQPLERQQVQPEWADIPAPFDESIPPEPSPAEVAAIAGELPARGQRSDAGAAQHAARLQGSAAGVQPVKTAPSQQRDVIGPPASPPDTERRPGTELRPASQQEDTQAPSPPESRKERTILRTLLQKCKPLGISEHLTFSVGDSSALVLAASSLNREVVASGMVGLMAEMRRFCEEYRLGEPFKCLVNSAQGAVVGAELVRGNPNRLIVLGSHNPSGAGTMSLLLERFEPELRNLPSLMGETANLQPAPTNGEREPKPTRLREDGFLTGASEKVVAELRDVGMEHSVSAATAENDKLLAVWGEGFDGHKLLTNGVFDIGLLSQYSSRTGAGDFQLALLVAQHAVVTLTRLPIRDRAPGNAHESEETGGDDPEAPIRTHTPAAYLLCFFPPNLPEGRVRAKASRAAHSLVL